MAREISTQTALSGIEKSGNSALQCFWNGKAPPAGTLIILMQPTMIPVREKAATYREQGS